MLSASTNDNQKMKDFEITNNYKVQVPGPFLCSISQDVMAIPILGSDGNTYEASQLASWIVRHATSPLTNKQIEKEMTFNRYVYNDIRNFFSALLQNDKETLNDGEHDEALAKVTQYAKGLTADDMAVIELQEFCRNKIKLHGFESLPKPILPENKTIDEYTLAITVDTPHAIEIAPPVVADTEPTRISFFCPAMAGVGISMLSNYLFVEPLPPSPINELVFGTGFSATIGLLLWCLDRSIKSVSIMNGSAILTNAFHLIPSLTWWQPPLISSAAIVTLTYISRGRTCLNNNFSFWRRRPNEAADEPAHIQDIKAHPAM